MGYGYYPRYVSVAEKRARAEKKIKQLRKKNPDIRPVILGGQALATTWWGKAWNSNLERYADYTNRIGRGRSYVRHMAVVDLQISPGRVDALVQGSRGAPYKVRITIADIRKKTGRPSRSNADRSWPPCRSCLPANFQENSRMSSWCRAGDCFRRLLKYLLIVPARTGRICASMWPRRSTASARALTKTRLFFYAAQGGDRGPGR